MEVQITVRGGTGYVSALPSEPEKLGDAMLKATSFRPVGYQYTKLFKSKRHDGRIRLLKHNRFPAGLLTNVIGVLQKHDVPYQLSVEDATDNKPHLAMQCQGLESRWYQDEAVEAAVLNPRGVIRAPTGCLAGETLIAINRGGKCKNYRLDEAYYRFNGLETNARKSWDRSIETRCRALVGGEIRQHRVRGIVDSGERRTVLVKLASGKVLRCTPDHLIATPDGWHSAGDLEPGNAVLCNGRFLDKDGYVMMTVPNTWKNHPRVHCDGKGGYTVREHQIVMEEMLGRTMEPGEVVHHRNGIKSDNRLENLELHTVETHGRLHGDRTRFHNAVHPRNGAKIHIWPYEDVVVSVSPAGICRTFDIQMEDPHNNFVANGIVVHNSGKTAVIARVIAARERWALVIVPTIDLLHQTKRFLEEHLDGRDLWRLHGSQRSPIGQLGDGVVDPNCVTVATARTAAKALNVAYTSYEFGEYDDKDNTDVDPRDLREWLESIGTLCVDEAHILGAQTVYDITTKLPAPNKYGFSASPWRDDGADLMIQGATGPVIHRISAEDLVKDGYLVPPIIQTVPTAGWWMPAAWGQTCTRCSRMRPMTDKGPAQQCSCGYDRWRSEFPDAYKHEIVENVKRNERIAGMVQCLPAPRLVLVKQIKHGRLLKDLIPDAVFLSGKDPGLERAAVYDRVREGTLQTVICTTIADMGLDLPALRTLVLAGGGKALDVDTPIPTPRGWSRMGDLKLGDEIFSETGLVCRVIGAHPVLYDRPCYEVVFSDGATVIADGDHLWTTKITSLAGQIRTQTTEQIAKTLRTNGGRINHAIPLCDQLDLPDRDLPLDPYVLGAWLGDGTSVATVLNVHIDESEYFCRQLNLAGFHTRSYSDTAKNGARISFGIRPEREVRVLDVDGMCECGCGESAPMAAKTRIAIGHIKGEPVRFRPGHDSKVRRGGMVPDGTTRTKIVRQLDNGTRATLRSLNVFDNKHIPIVYLRGSVAQRRALLQGLMDTDGYISKMGAAEITVKRRELRDGVMELLRTLGYKPAWSEKMVRLRGRVYGPYYRIRFQPYADEPPARMPRKVKRLSSRRKGARTNRQIVDIRPVISRPVRCIEVDSPSRLYLAGEGMIPTHNSSTRHLQRIGRIARPHPGKESALVVDFDDTHVHKWFQRHAAARRKIERAEYAKVALWV